MRPSLLTIARRALSEATGEASVKRGATILAAVSGGPDSIALLHVLALLSSKLGIRVVAHGVDHGLRPEAREELAASARIASALGVSFTTTRVRVARGGNLQARARDARWKALARAATKTGASVIATGHHADDRAETFLLRLLQGSGVRGLAVMPPKSSLPMPVHGAEGIEVVRPLLRARRSDVMLHLERHELSYANDPSNDDERYRRARMRRDVLPLLEELDPSIVEHIGRIADDLGHGHGHGKTKTGWVEALPRGTREEVEKMARSRSTTARVWLPGGIVASWAPRRG